TRHTHRRGERESACGRRIDLRTRERVVLVRATASCEYGAVVQRCCRVEDAGSRHLAVGLEEGALETGDCSEDRCGCRDGRLAYGQTSRRAIRVDRSYRGRTRRPCDQRRGILGASIIENGSGGELFRDEISAEEEGGRERDCGGSRSLDRDRALPIQSE